VCAGARCARGPCWRLQLVGRSHRAGGELMPQPPEFEGDQGQSEAPKRTGAGVIVIGASAGCGGAPSGSRRPTGRSACSRPGCLAHPAADAECPAGHPESCGKLPAVAAEHGMPAQPGTIYVAPADHHSARCRHASTRLEPARRGSLRITARGSRWPAFPQTGDRAADGVSFVR
jgi:hypothetical protein